MGGPIIIICVLNKPGIFKYVADARHPILQSNVCLQMSQTASLFHVTLSTHD